MSSIKLSSPAKMIPVAKPLIDHAALHDFGSRAQQLLLEQRQEWPMLRRDYASLPAVQTRTLDFQSASNGHPGADFRVAPRFLRLHVDGRLSCHSRRRIHLRVDERCPGMGMNQCYEVTHGRP